MCILSHPQTPQVHEARRRQATVELDFKNCQNKNHLGFKNQIIKDQLDKISFKNRQDKSNLTLRTKMALTKNVLKVKFDCTSKLASNVSA